MSSKDTFEEFDYAVSKDKVFECERLADEIEALGRKGGAAKVEVEKRAKVIKKVREDVTLVNKLLKEIKSEEGWTFAATKRGITIHFKQPEGSPFIMTKARKIIQPIPGKPLTHTFISLCSLFAETDLMPKWFPRGLMESQETLLKETAFSRFTRIRIALPIFVPISNREAIIHGKGYDMTERSAMAITFKSLSQDFKHESFEMPEMEKKYTRIDIEGAFYIEIQPDGSVVFDQLQSIDLKIKFIPPFIFNAVSKGQLPLEFNGNLMKRLMSFDGSEWESRVRAQPELYEDIKKRLEDYLESKGYGLDGKPKANADAPAITNGEPAGQELEEGSFFYYLQQFFGLFLSEESAKDYAQSAASKFSSETPQDEQHNRSSKRRSIRLSLLGRSKTAVEMLKEEESDLPKRSLSKRFSRIFSSKGNGAGTSEKTLSKRMSRILSVRKSKSKSKTSPPQLKVQ